MKIIEENNLKILIAAEGYFLKSREDVYKEAYEDKFGNQMRDHIPYCFERGYIPKNITLEKAKEIYEEIKREEVGEWSN